MSQEKRQRRKCWSGVFSKSYSEGSRLIASIVFILSDQLGTQ